MNITNLSLLLGAIWGIPTAIVIVKLVDYAIDKESDDYIKDKQKRKV